MYKVIKADSLEDLADAVNDAIEEGYEPIGGVAAVDERGKTNPDGTNAITLFQAVIMSERHKLAGPLYPPLPGRETEPATTKSGKE